MTLNMPEKGQACSGTPSSIGKNHEKPAKHPDR